ncbi:uncharacterized protein V6R79_024414 [Siganus canaliculatus]
MDPSAPSLQTLAEVKAEAAKYKKKYEQLLQDQKDLTASRDDRRKLAENYKKRTEKLALSIEKDERDNEEKLQKEQEKLVSLRQEETHLKKEIEKMKVALMEEEAQTCELREQAKVFSSLPERDVYFNGMTGKPSDAPKFQMEPSIVYPMQEGTALITFEEKEVATNILDMRKHRVDLGGEFRITVEARPVQLMMPGVVEINAEVCPRRILISDLPRLDVGTLKDKLEIYFSKGRNGGGEVDHCELMSDSWTVVLTFVRDDIAQGLIDKKDHEVDFQQAKHKVKVSPFLNGSITNLKSVVSTCPRTVVLKGIPDIMEQESLQDLLEIYFQKSTNGGGEIEAIYYNPLGHQADAMFDGLSENDK